MRVEVSQLEHVGGHCWRLRTSADDFPETDDESDPRRSTLVLSEDGRDLGPTHAAIDMVVQEGSGQYSHWQNVLYLSSSDNSDPTCNGRTYELRRDAAAYFAQTAGYSMAIVDGWAARLANGMEDIRGRNVLEIGPGRSMGTVAVFAALGCRVLAVDRFCGEWQDNWHGPFLEALIGHMEARGQIFDTGLVRRMIADETFDGSNIQVETRPLEDLSGAYRSFADLSFSHSTFEHFYSVETAAGVMAEIVRQSGFGVHDVDFRDHANFGSPLEFLSLSEEEYARDEVNRLYGRGNRVRPSAMKAMFEGAGFSRVEFAPYAEVDEAYLDSFIPRLSASADSPFRKEAREELRTAAGTFTLVR